MPILKTIKPYCFLFCFLGLVIWAAPSYANNATLSFVPENSANPLKLSFVVDRAVKIAGMKTTIVYNEKLLIFKKAEKTPATSSFLHVVNDKNPGKLIIVMASAKGISGDKVPLFRLEFARVPDVDKQKQTIAVTQVQLMDENLKEIKANLPEYTF